MLQHNGFDASAIKVDLLVMKSASLRAARTIKDLLTLGRQGHTAKEILDVNVVIRGWFENENPQLNSTDERHTNVVLDLSQKPAIVLACEAHVVRAVANLVRNATEASDGAGTIGIRTYHQSLSESVSGFEPIDAGDYVVIAVADNGRGIAREDLPRVFEPFFSKKRLDESSGSGLGLAIVHGVVKEHGGFVDVRSEIGKGTEFLLYFRPAHETITTTEEATSKPPPSARILIVDDDPVQLRTANRVLARQGHAVTAVNSGAKAYSVIMDGMGAGPNEAGQPPFDVVVIDMLLNEADDGLSIFQKMRARFPALRGLVVSGHSPTERTRLAVTGGLAWLSKPYTAEALAQSVKRLLVALSRPPNELG